MLSYNSNSCRKTILTLIILFIGFLNTYSQSIDSAFKYLDSGRYEKAAGEFEKVLPLIERAFGATDTSYYSFFLVYAGVSFEKNRQYDRAEQCYLKAREIYEKSNAFSNKTYIILLNSLASLYNRMGKFEDAESVYEKLLEINRKKYGEAYPENVVLLNNIASLYHKMGNYEKAESMFKGALGISKNAFGEEDPISVSLLNNLGALYDDKGDYVKAESIYLKTLEIRKRIPGIEHPDYAISANNLAQLYYKMGNYEKAEPLYQQALLINKKIYGEEHVNYATSLNNLGALYHTKGNYEKAELFYLEALGIRKKVLGVKHPDYATSLNNVALFYTEIGNNEKAEPLYIQALEIRGEVLGEDHPLYSVTLNNMALFYFGTGNYEKAETLLRQALNIRKKASGEDHPDYAISLSNLALFYCDMSRYKEAEALYLQALKINKKVFGEMNPGYATTLNNLAELYDAMGRYDEAEKLYLQALDILNKVYGENHPDYASALSNLALLYQEGGYYKKAEPVYQQALNIYLSQIRQQFSFLSETEKEKYLAKVLFFFKTYQNFILSQQKNNRAIAGKLYDIELYSKGLLLNSDKQLRMFILNSGDSNSISTFNSYSAVKASLARQYSVPKGQQTLDTKSLETQANELEKQLARIYSGKNDLNEFQNVHWQDVQKQLNINEAAIEFSHFQYFNGKQWTDSIMYVAVLLKHDDIYPRIIPLFEARQLDTVLQRRTGSDNNFINDLYQWDRKSDKAGPGKGQQLYNLVWEPLEKYLDNTQTVYYSPSGRLHQLSFAAIPCGGTEILSDRYNMNQLSSSVQIAIKHQERPIKKIVLYGGIDYDEGLEKMKIAAGKYKRPAEKIPVTAECSLKPDNTRSGSFMYLDGTMTEVEKIRKLAEDKGVNCSVFTDNEAVEESVKRLSGSLSPDVLHIATHGFFFPDAVKIFGKTGLNSKGEPAAPAFKVSENPLMRSGLAFAGANHKWAGEEIPLDMDDGILTAYEVSNMYMPNTELVVLSACETGLGEIKGSEGVYGLQRSFKMAGAEHILMSLWQIPDYQTCELMELFYKNCLNGMTIKEGFRTAQQIMRKKYDPFFWAAFVLIE
jgi:tetratricopeptide (TPR) repeat protein/CHAT domain-containing protein